MQPRVTNKFVTVSFTESVGQAVRIRVPSSDLSRRGRILRKLTVLILNAVWLLGILVNFLIDSNHTTFNTSGLQMCTKNGILTATDALFMFSKEMVARTLKAKLIIDNFVYVEVCSENNLTVRAYHGTLRKFQIIK